MKAIFFDIDGTLVSKQTPYLTNELLKCFSQLKDQGILLFISTGRHMLEIEQLGILKQYQFDGYITMNGGYCIVGDQLVHQAAICKEDARHIHEYLTKYHHSSLYVEKDAMYCNFVDSHMIHAFDDIHTPLPQIKAIDDIDHHTYYLFCPFVVSEDMKKLMSVTQHCTCTQWNEYGYDIIPEDCSKSVGIQKVLEYLNIDIHETMAFGDGMNDIEMLSLVEIGVAMKNAKQEVKAVSDYITDDVDHFGIIKALEHFKIIEKGIL